MIALSALVDSTSGATTEVSTSATKGILVLGLSAATIVWALLGLVAVLVGLVLAPRLGRSSFPGADPALAPQSSADGYEPIHVRAAV